MMPGLDGYAVCRAIRADARRAMLPVVLVTALDPAQERVKGLEAGADDFLNKPVNQAELMARVRSLLRIKALSRRGRSARRPSSREWNRTLEQRVADGVAQLERVGRLKRFFSPQLAEAIVGGGTDDPLKSHRREITVVFLDLRGFTAFTETRRPRRGDGRAARVPRRDGPADRSSTKARSSASPATASWCSSTTRCRCPMPAPRAVRMALRMQGEVASARARLAAPRLRRSAWAWASRWALRPSAPSASRGASTTAPSAP